MNITNDNSNSSSDSNDSSPDSGSEESHEPTGRFQSPTVRRTRWKRAVKRIQELSGRVHEQQREIADLRKLAYTDPLTGLANRRAFDEQLERAMHHLHRDRRGIAVILIDVDQMKQINDVHGHPGGDAALRWVADRLRRVMRRHDQVARIGGDEFAVLLPGAGLTEARRVAERIRSTLRQTEPMTGRVVTVSAGVAMLTSGDAHRASSSLLMRRADEALYAAKAAGRDRVDTAALLASGE
ncbi:MAG: GGDEF domain-containing protein [bacterium]